MRANENQNPEKSSQIGSETKIRVGFRGGGSRVNRFLNLALRLIFHFSTSRPAHKRNEMFAQLRIFFFLLLDT